MRAALLAVVVMGVLILAGVGGLAVVMVRRLSGGGGLAGPVRLDEPAGTAIAAASVAGDRLAVQLRGGGPDRVVVLDLRSGATLARVALAP